MITVTEEAKVLLKNVEFPEGVPEDTVLRLDPVAPHPENGESQIGMYFGEPRDDDQIVEHEERDVLRISWVVSEALKGSTLYQVQTPEGRGLGIDNPNTEAQVSGDLQ
jgi:Fe-S cluster assembly iron-binding protein IscA